MPFVVFIKNATSLTIPLHNGKTFLVIKQDVCNLISLTVKTKHFSNHTTKTNSDN